MPIDHTPSAIAPTSAPASGRQVRRRRRERDPRMARPLHFRGERRRNPYFMRMIVSHPNRLFASRPFVSGMCTSALLATVGVGLSQPVWATEGGIGRPITGMQVTPYGGIVPPTSDWI